MARTGSESTNLSDLESSDDSDDDYDDDVFGTSDECVDGSDDKDYDTESDIDVSYAVTPPKTKMPRSRNGMLLLNRYQHF